MRELSLFTGAGGGVLGSKLLGWDTIGYIEFNDYCQRIIAQRIEDEILDNAPIFGDIRAFIAEGFADAYSGMVDVVTAGFPCQPFSVAGQRQGADDSRNMWPQTIDVIRRVRPRFAFLENVPGLLTHEYARRIFGDLAESGFNARWRVLSAAEVGAPHKRDRLWIVAESAQHGCRKGRERGFISEHPPVQNAESTLADTDTTRRKQQWRAESARTEQQAVKCGSWWATEPDVGRVANEFSDWLDFFGAVKK